MTGKPRRHSAEYKAKVALEAINRLIGTILLAQNDDWAVQRVRRRMLPRFTQSRHTA